jgi:hypothetical protein
MKNIVFYHTSNKIEVVKATQFIYNGLILHIRKDYVFAGDKHKNWIITENTSGAKFAWHNTKKEVLIFMDLLFECYNDEIEQIVKNVKAKQFDRMVQQIAL